MEDDDDRATAEGPRKKNASEAMIVCRLSMHHRSELVSRALSFHCSTYLTTRNWQAAVVLPISLKFSFYALFCAFNF